MASYSVYILTDPAAPFSPRYVGLTAADPAKRLAWHISKAKSDVPRFKASWIRHLEDRGRRPVLQVMFTSLSEHEARFIERALIAQHRSLLLLNVRQGGDVVSERTRLKISEALQGHDVKGETRLRMSTAARAAWQRRRLT
jgi:hypothetical protein